MADANAGKPAATPTAALNSQVRDAPANLDPGKAQTMVAANNTAAAATTAPVAAAGTAPPLYAQVCSTCHAAGVAGAPKVGDKAAWAPRIAQGIDALTASAIKGKGAMPPQRRLERERGRDQGRRHLHGQRGEVARSARDPTSRPEGRLFQFVARGPAAGPGDSRSGSTSAVEGVSAGRQRPRSTASLGHAHVERVDEAEAEVAGQEEPSRLRRRRPRSTTAGGRCGWSRSPPAAGSSCSRQTHGAASSST